MRTPKIDERILNGCFSPLQTMRPAHEYLVAIIAKNSIQRRIKRTRVVVPSAVLRVWCDMNFLTHVVTNSYCNPSIDHPATDLNTAVDLVLKNRDGLLWPVGTTTRSHGTYAQPLFRDDVSLLFVDLIANAKT